MLSRSHFDSGKAQFLFERWANDAHSVALPEFVSFRGIAQSRHCRLLINAACHQGHCHVHSMLKRPTEMPRNASKKISPQGLMSRISARRRTTRFRDGMPFSELFRD